MRKDEEFEEMLEGLDIVAEALDEEPHAVLPRINQLKRRKTLLELQSDLFDPIERQHVFYRLFLNSTFRKFGAGVLIVSFINVFYILMVYVLR